MLTSRIAITLTAALSAALDLVTPDAELTKKKVIDLASGTLADQADKVFSDTRTLAASITEDLDLAGGGLLDALGGAFTLVKLRAVLIIASALNTNNVVVGGDANAVPIFGAAASVHAIKPGGVLLLVDRTLAGWAVTPGTGDILQIANSGAGTGVTYDIVLIGTSA